MPTSKARFKLPHESSVTFINEEAYSMAKHTHDALQVLVPLDHAHFELSWAQEDKTFETKTMGPGDVCIIPPYLEHEVKWMNKSHLVNLYLSKEFICYALDENMDLQDKVLSPEIGVNDKFILTLCKRLEEMLPSQCVHNNLLLESSTILLCNHIYEKYIVNPEHETLVNSLDQLPCEKIRTAALYMSNILDRFLSIEEIAGEVGMSQYHLIRMFKEMMGATPSKLHMLYRLEESKNLLANTEKPLADIAYELGFSSQAHFSKAFAQHYGETPKKFRTTSA